MAHATATAPANESFLTHLFNPAGRTNRAKYWLAFLIYVLIYAVGITLYVVLAQQAMDSIGIIIGLVVGAVVFVTIMVSSILIAIRRLHDRDKSGHWLWLFYVLPAILNGAGAVVMSAGPDAAVVGILLNVVSFGISIWALVELGFLRGTRGSNRFGPDPLLV